MQHGPTREATMTRGVRAVIAVLVGSVAMLAASGGASATSRPSKDQPGWTPVSYSHGVLLADRRSVTEPDGHVITIYRFKAGTVRFALHTGSLDPPGVAQLVGPGAGPRISAAEAPHVIAAFNGGFKVATGSGGFEVNSRVFVALRGSIASLVIDASGAARVGTWGSHLPVAGEHVVAVRQNLQPLISGGRLSALITDWGAWGATVGGLSSVARSSLGEDRQGNLLYAASMSALPVDLGNALLTAGAIQAMELDINPDWIQMDSTPRPGGPLVAGIPHQSVPGNQYNIGWTRDFVTVMAVK